jgi:hypothetical protein
MTVMCPQLVRNPVEYLKELGSCHDGDVPSVGMWSRWIFERTRLMSWWQCALGGTWSCWTFEKMSQWGCALRKYVILSNIWKNLADVTAVMCLQEVCDPVEHLKELGWCHHGDVPSGSMWCCWIFERTWLISWRWCALSVCVTTSDCCCSVIISHSFLCISRQACVSTLFHYHLSWYLDAQGN